MFTDKSFIAKWFVTLGAGRLATGHLFAGVWASGKFGYRTVIKSKCNFSNSIFFLPRILGDTLIITINKTVVTVALSEVANNVLCLQQMSGQNSISQGKEYLDRQPTGPSIIRLLYCSEAFSQRKEICNSKATNILGVRLLNRSDFSLFLHLASDNVGLM